MERPRPTIRSMRAFPVVVGTALAATVACGGAGRAVRRGRLGRAERRAAPRRRILPCSHAHLRRARCSSTMPHEMGTRADALAVARDIRASTARRLARVTALSVPPELQHTSSRWISSQRRLASLYARTWVRIYDTIDAARTPAQRATLAERLEKLVHAPDPLKLAAGRLELELHVPDCTGGG